MDISYLLEFLRVRILGEAKLEHSGSESLMQFSLGSNLD
jgi:hypothetical protein